jgi:hypothetical protein
MSDPAQDAAPDPAHDAAALPIRRRDTILAALEAFREENLPRSLSALMLFLYICENEGLTVSELAFVSRTPVAMAARIVKMLAGETPDALLTPDCAIFEYRTSAKDKRLKFVYLAQRGRLICDRLERLIEDAAPIRTRKAEAATARLLDRGPALADLHS